MNIQTYETTVKEAETFLTGQHIAINKLNKSRELFCYIEFSTKRSSLENRIAFFGQKIQECTYERILFVLQVLSRST